MMQHRYEQALALAERSVALHEEHGSGHGLAVALATLGQICVRLGDLARAEDALHRALDVRSPIQFHETTGAVFDTLAQIQLDSRPLRRRRAISSAAPARRTAPTACRRAAGTSGRCACSARASRCARSAWTRRSRCADEILGAGAPPFDALQATLIAAEALIAADRLAEAEQRLATAADALDPKSRAGRVGRVPAPARSRCTRRAANAADAYHDFAQSATLLELLGERYQAALSHLALGRLVAQTGARSIAERHLTRRAARVFDQLGAERDVADTRAAQALLTSIGTGEYLISPADADDAIVRRIVDAAALPDLLGAETAAALLEASAADGAVVFVAAARRRRARRRLGRAATPMRRALLARSGAHGDVLRPACVVVEPLGRDPEGPRFGLIASPRPDRPSGDAAAEDDRDGGAAGVRAVRGARSIVEPRRRLAVDPSLEPLIPGFLAASAAMTRVMEQIQRMAGNDLTVLITGESGTGKELVARAIHVGSHRSAAMFLPYNCTTTGRDLADSQLFGHRRGSFTGAVSDQPGLVRSAAGGTLFLDEIGDLAARRAAQAAALPRAVRDPADRRDAAAARGRARAGGDQRRPRAARGRRQVSRGPVLSTERHPHSRAAAARAARRDSAPRTYFLREASERLGKPDITLSSEALDVFSQYWWPGNVRQLKNEIQRAVAMSAPGGTIEPGHLSPEITATRAAVVGGRNRRGRHVSARDEPGRSGRTGRARDDPDRPWTGAAVTSPKRHGCSV